MSSLLLDAEPLSGAYAERLERSPGGLDRLAERALAPLLRRRVARRARWARFPPLVGAHGEEVSRLGDAALREAARALADELRAGGLTEDRIARSFAMVREVAGRTLGERHFDVQLIGGRVLLEGMVAEMETGEGKTLTATLAACTAALAGIPVHVITVNDYLARRDAEWMGPIYQALGFGRHRRARDGPAARRAAYASDVTYVTNKEVAFDYLRDRIALGRRTSRTQLQLERLAGDETRLQKLVLARTPLRHRRRGRQRARRRGAHAADHLRRWRRRRASRLRDGARRRGSPRQRDATS